MATNRARKERLAAIAKDRLGYQEYLELRDSLDKNISQTYAKLQKKDAPKPVKKRKKGVVEPNGMANGNGDHKDAIPLVPPPAPSAMGFTMDDSNIIHPADSLQTLVETRRKWVDAVGGVFERKQMEDPGRIWGFPEKSVYEGVEEEVKALLDVRPPVVRMQAQSQQQQQHQALVIPLGKGKGKSVARGDEMDIG